jgi:Mg-chelatase subunit ChlD
MKKVKLCTWLTLTLVMAALVFVLPAGAQTAVGSLINISNIDASRFPEVAIYARVIGADGTAVAGLTSPDVSVVENGVQITQNNIVNFEATSDAPMNIIFVVDRGRYTTPALTEEVRDGMNALITNGYFRDGVDNVAILYASGTSAETLLPLTKSASAFQQAVGNLSLDAGSRTESLAGVNAALLSLTNNDFPTTGPTAIVVIARTIEKPAMYSVETITAAARAAFIPINVWYASLNPTADDNNDYLRDLAQNSGGSHLTLSNRGDNTPAISALFSALNSKRQQYVIRFRSSNGISGERRVQISTGSANAETTYSVSPQPPTVQITQPVDGQSIDREMVIDEEREELSFGVSSTDVVAEVTWLDGYTRNLTSAELVVNGVSQGAIIPSGTRLILPFSLSHIQQSGDNPQTLSVTIQDELNLTSTSPTVTVKVPLTIPENLTIIDEVVVRSACEEDANSWDCRIEMARTYVPYLGFAVMAFIAFHYRRQVAHGINAGATMVGTVVTSAGTAVRNTILGTQAGGFGDSRDNKPFAVLEVLEGPDAIIGGRPIGRRVELFNRRTTIGRDPGHVDVQFYSLREDSTISRIHCRIDYDEANRQFVLIDERSSAGTKINDLPVTPGLPTPLPNGAYVEIGKARNRGVRFIFYDMVHTVEARKTQVGDTNPRVTQVPGHNDIKITMMGSPDSSRSEQYPQRSPAEPAHSPAPGLADPPVAPNYDNQQDKGKAPSKRRPRQRQTSKKSDDWQDQLKG